MSRPSEGGLKPAPPSAPCNALFLRPRRTRAVAAALLWLSAEAGLLACPVCFRFEESAVTDGVRLAVFVLIGVTAIVLAGFIAFARRVAQRQRADP